MKPLSARKGLVVYGLALAFMLVCSALSNLIATYIFGVGFIGAGLVFLARNWSPSVPAGGSIEATVVNPVVPGPEVEAGATPAAAPSKPRLYYLDNLKGFLTVVVINHHILASYLGSGWVYGIGNYRKVYNVFASSVCLLDQAYFMALFFFVSGLFVPSSCERKGRAAFLSDRLKRLGLPFLAFIFFLFPLVCYAFPPSNASRYAYSPSPGPPWFCFWLLLFSAAYAGLEDGAAPADAPAPTVAALVKVGLACGAVQYGVMAASPGQFVFMPITFGSLPFDVVFFAAGVVAKRSGWLAKDNFDALRASAGLLVVRVVVVGTSLLLVAVTVFIYVRRYDIPGLLAVNSGDDDGTFDDDADDDADDEGVAVPGWVLSVIYPALCLLLGPFATCTSLFLVELFEGNCNVTSPLLGELTKSAYAAYLVQPFLISPATWLWTEVLRTQFGDKVYFAPGSSQSTTEVPEGLIWAGLAFSLCFVHALIWPLSAGLRRLPGLRAIL